MNTFKKIFITMLAASVFSFSAVADEGMWLLPLLEKMNIKTMQEMGCELTAEEIYSINNSSLKDAIVIFGGGCTAEIVSDKGLVLTNHHCGYSAIQKLSSVDHDYLTDGYWAMNYDQELPAAGLSVTFIESFTDVTDRIEKALKNVNSDEERDLLLGYISKEIVNEATEKAPYLSASVESFFGGNTYYLVVYKVYRDIRFVGAPPSSIGKFGADTDNWMWPRHTCDFSMFRIYADKNGNPAAYSKDNVPYNPQKHLTVSLKGIKEGDFSMIMGFPGSTNRYLTGPEITMVKAQNEAGIYCRGRRQDALLEDMLADPAVRIKYSSKYSSSSNYWKNWIGMNEQIDKLNVEQRRKDNDDAFRAWVAKKPSRQKKYGNTMDEIYSTVAQSQELIVNYNYVTESVNRIEIFTVANNINNRFINYASSDASARQQIMDGAKAYLKSFYKDYNMPTDLKVAKVMMEVCKEKMPANLLPDFFQTVDDKFNGSISDFVDYIFACSQFVSMEKALAAIESKALTGEISFTDDPAYICAQSVRTIAIGINKDLSNVSVRLAKAQKSFIAGQLEMKDGQPIYPDANFTMRLTYGNVKSYEPKDGVEYKYYTTLKGVMEKEDPDNWEFVVPAKLKELYEARDYGRYANADGSMPNCFIMTGDITGGNSGSPVLNGKGQLTGLAFDGNWEAMSGDIIFEPDLQRCICVDIRYVLFIIDKFGGAGYLLDEMTIDQ